MPTARIKNSLLKATRSFIHMLPIVLGMLLLTSLLMNASADHLAGAIFTGRELADAVLATLIGSVAAGHPSAAYVLGGELLAAGVSLMAVAALMVSWVTVGIVQLPAEAMLLGKRFAISRNLVSLTSAPAVAFLTIFTLRLIE